jgi:hypothetical protein
MRPTVIIALLGAAWVSNHVQPAPAQGLSFANLEGHSIIAEYQEVIVPPRGPSIQQTWRDRVYFSTKGRIFHSFALQSSLPQNSGVFEAVGDQEGAGAGPRSKYTWTGQGIARQWTIAPTGGGYGCRMTVERLSAFGGATPLGQSCQVVRGNVLAGN